MESSKIITEDVEMWIENGIVSVLFRTQHILDPIGPNLVPPSLTAYENLLYKLAKEIVNCLGVTATFS